jgi:predicted enzyme related to lactoylglutathione lyase
MALAHFSLVVIDCPDPLSLAAFYSSLTGLEIEPQDGVAPDDVTGADLMNGDHPTIHFQKVEQYVAPTWPDGPIPQQFHIDFEVEDLDTAEQHALAIGATKAAGEPGGKFRVFLDPVGHPFCLCKWS